MWSPGEIPCLQSQTRRSIAVGTERLNPQYYQSTPWLFHIVLTVKPQPKASKTWSALTNGPDQCGFSPRWLGVVLEPRNLSS